MAKVAIQGVCKEYDGVKILDKIDLDIESGEFVVIVGPSGCGKSTLLRLLAGLEEFEAGLISIDEQDLDGLSPGERGLAMVFQSYALYPHKTVAQNIGFPLRMAHEKKDVIARKVHEAARILQIEHLLERKPRQLSGGQKQRVAIGRAIVRQPKVFLFDEPLSNLDADLRGQMRAEIVRLHKVLGTTMLYVTHDQIEAMTMANRIVVLRDGLVQQVGTPLELYQKPQNKFIASFIGTPQIVFVACEAKMDGDMIRLSIGESHENILLPAKDHPSITTARTLGIRPDTVFFEQIPEDTPTLDFHIERTELLGSRTRYFGKLSAGEPISIDVPGTPGILDGQKRSVGLNPEKLHFFDAGEQTL